MPRSRRSEWRAAFVLIVVLSAAAWSRRPAWLLRWLPCGARLTIALVALPGFRYSRHLRLTEAHAVGDELRIAALGRELRSLVRALQPDVMFAWGMRAGLAAATLALHPLFFLLAGNACTLPILIASVFLFSLLFNAAIDPYSALLADLFPPERRSTVNSVATVVQFVGTIAILRGAAMLSDRHALTPWIFSIVAIGMVHLPNHDPFVSPMGGESWELAAAYLAVLLAAAGEGFRGRVMGVRMLVIYGLPVGLLAAMCLRARGYAVDSIREAMANPGARRLRPVWARDSSKRSRARSRNSPARTSCWRRRRRWRRKGSTSRSST